MANSGNDNSITNLVEKLRHRLKSFAIVSPNGERLGEVQDFILDSNRQLKLVVQANNNPDSQAFLLISKLIQKIEPANKTVLVNLNKAEFEKLPKYAKPDATLWASTINPISSASESVSEGISAGSDRMNYPSDLSAGDNVQTPLFETQNMQNEVQNNINLEHSNDTEETASLGEEIIRLLGERVVVERSKRKVGEVIVRKEIVTRMIQVPVRYEKLIIEEVGNEPRQLAEIILGEASVNNNDQPETVITSTKTSSQDEVNSNAITQDKTSNLNGELTVRGKFDSPKIASLLLNAIAMERNQGCKQIRVEIVVENEERKKTYQEWFERTSKQ